MVVPLVVVGLHRSSTDVPQVAICMAVSGLTSVVLCAVVRWCARLAYGANVRVQLGMPMLLTALVIALNVVLLARLLFLSSADVQLLLAFVAFGMAVAVALISPLPRRLARAVSRIDLAARRLAAGEYGVRIAEDERDTELAPVARAINQVAVTLQDAARQQHAAEGERAQLVRALSHDLRTPISAIQVMVEAIADGVVTDPKTMERYHHTLRAQTRHLAVLLDELFELTRLEAGALILQRQVVWIDEMLFDVVDAMRACTEQRHLQLEVHVAETLPPLEGDPAQIHRALTSLLQAAVHRTPDSGAILVRACVTPSYRGPRSESDEVGEDVEVQIIDSGAGIEAAQLPSLFEPAYRTETAHEYTPCTDAAPLAPGDAGMGLAVAARIIAAHGGRISAASPLPPAAQAAIEAATDGVSDAPRRVERAGTVSEAPGTLITFTLPTATSPWAL
jgi:signal transduction histidine kinase